MVTTWFFGVSLLLVLSCVTRRSPVRKWLAGRQRPGRAIGVLSIAWLLVFAVLAAINPPSRQDGTATNVAETSPPTTPSSPSPRTTSVKPSTTTTSTPPPAEIASVVDGNTVILADGRRVRLVGVDAPELSSACGTDAVVYLTKFVGSAVDVVVDSARTAADGTVAASLRPMTGDDLSTQLAASGWAVFHAATAPVAHAAQIQNAVATARTAGLGQWSSTGCAAPKPAPIPTPEVSTVPDLPSLPEPAPTTAKKRTGHSGHPCLPGERDGDNDGYCGEGR